VALINIFFLYRNGIPFPVRDSLKILLASLCMGMAGKAVSVFFMAKGGIVAALLGGMAASILVYAAAVALLGCLTREEAVQLPVIGKIVKALWKAE
jgi:stage V sporulation protein B